jgi:hypothetical protein
MPAPLAPMLDHARAVLLRLRGRAEKTPTHPLIDDFLRSIFQIGLVIGGDPERSGSSELRFFLDETAPDLIEEHVALLFYPGRLLLEFQHTWESDEWEQLCRRRSGLQFFLDLYRDTALGPFVEEIETDDLDDEMREWGKREGFLSPAEIDPRIPRSHWWWWAPGSPADVTPGLPTP